MRNYNLIFEKSCFYKLCLLCAESGTPTKTQKASSRIPIVVSQVGCPFLILKIMENSTTKTCPFCAEIIKKEAVKCKHCGSDLTAKIFNNVKNNKPKEGLFLQTLNFGCAIIFIIIFIVIILIAIGS